MQSIVALSLFGLLFAAGMMSRPANAPVLRGDQPVMMIGQLTASAKDLPVQSFDAF
jgi:hypothetical protein